MQINLLEYFDNTLNRFPHKTAVIDREETITFADLGTRAQKLGQILIEKGLMNRPVAVFLPKSIASVCSDLGIIYSGNPYMNLDIKTPAERLHNILNLVQPGLIITDNKHRTLLGDVPQGIELLNFDEINFDFPLNSEILDKRRQLIIDTDPLCIINTSGSTGTPKSVVLNHRSFIDFTDWAQTTFNFSEQEVIGSLSPLVFDIYSYELCLLMSRSATMVLIPDNLSAFPIKILEILAQREVSFLFWVPTIMVNIANLDLLSKIDLSTLKRVWFAGEVFPTKQFNYWRRSLPQTLFANLYGPIEITLDCTYYIVEREIKDEEPLPIGFPCRNSDVLILTDENKPASGQQEGELCVRGTSLAMGYYNNPEKTAAAFTQNPLNNSYPELIYRTGDIVYKNELGEIVFKGRKDSLVKHQGYRIELTEIEHIIINKLKLAKNGCIVYNHAAKEITLYYESETEISAQDFRKIIANELPKYMIPTVYRRMDILPRNTNGKIDRLALKNMTEAA